MKNILVITGSDILGLPALHTLRQQNRVAAVAVPARVAGYLIPILKSIGITGDEIHILTKENLATELRQLINTYKIETVFTLTFPWMIPGEILQILPGRFINFHFGLLPKYKGADPIFWQLKNGEQHCGVTVHVMSSEIDAGPVVLKHEIPVIPGETYGYNVRRLGIMGADVAAHVADLMNKGKLATTPMPDEPALYLKKPSQADLAINWQQQSAAEIENLVNAANPRYQGATTTIRQVPIRLLEVAMADMNNPDNQEFAPGTIIHADQLYGLIVACLNKQFLKINVAYMQEGYFSGSKLFSLGFAVGEVFA